VAQWWGGEGEGVMVGGLGARFLVVHVVSPLLLEKLQCPHLHHLSGACLEAVQGKALWQKCKYS